MRKQILWLVLWAAFGCSPPGGQPGDGAVAESPAAPVAPYEASFAGRDPSLRWDTARRLHIVYVEEVGETTRIAYRRLEPELSPATYVSPVDREVSSHGEVPPRIEVLADGGLVVAYTRRLPGRFQGEIVYQRSSDDGATWTAPQVLHDDGRPTGSRSFLDSELLADGTVAFAWLDNRGGQQGLLYAELDANGVTPNVVLDEIACQCCSTDLLDSTGSDLWLAYRELDDSGTRDIALLRRRGDGEFEPSVMVADDGWQVDACPHTGPRLTEGADGSLWATWFTGTSPSVRVAQSSDGGASFTGAETLAEVGGATTKVAHPEIGRLPDGRIVVLYESAGPDRSELLLRFRSTHGEWGPAEAFHSGGVYPRFETDGERAVVAFTDRREAVLEIVVRELS